MDSVRQRYRTMSSDGDTDSASGAPIFTLLISALKRLVISRPTQLGVSAQTHEVGVTGSDSQSHLQTHRSLDNIAEMVVTAVVSNVVRMIGTQAGLSVQTAATKVQWCVSRSVFSRVPTSGQLFFPIISSFY
jgi:hypothetical protein